MSRGTLEHDLVLFGFVYRTITLSREASQLSSTTKLHILCHVLNPIQVWFGLFPVRSPLLRKSNIFFLFLRVLRCFSSPGLPLITYFIGLWVLEGCSSGFPHSEISGSVSICDSPKHIGAYPVLHRLLVPRHSPYALNNLTYFMFVLFIRFSFQCSVRDNWQLTMDNWRSNTRSLDYARDDKPDYSLFIFHCSLLLWWRWGGSNSWPPACKAGALPAELHPHGFNWQFTVHSSQLRSFAFAQEDNQIRDPSTMLGMTINCALWFVHCELYI